MILVVDCWIINKYDKGVGAENVETAGKNGQSKLQEFGGQGQMVAGEEGS